MRDLIETEAPRAESYRLLSALFCLPDLALFTEERVAARLAEALGPVAPGAAAKARRLGEVLEGAEETALRVDYARLFVGPGELLAPPYGSVYLEEGRVVMGPSTQDVIRRYEDEGIAVDPEFQELPDHISAELEFLYVLAFRCRDAAARADEAAVRAYRRKQGEFLRDHLLRWGPEFAGRVEERAGQGFYRELARCLRAFLAESEARYAAEALGTEEARAATP
ncbi:TorD/DmsD family molecular chaperone [Deferrisoma sp.]